MTKRLTAQEARDELCGLRDDPENVAKYIANLDIIDLAHLYKRCFPQVTRIDIEIDDGEYVLLIEE